MSAFTRFCSLCHLDLDLLGAYQVTAGNTKSTGCYLLDGRATVLSVLADGKALFFLTTFTGIGFSVQHVHGDRHSLMCFLGNRSIGHGTCLKSLNDLIYGFYFINADALFRIFEIQKSAQVHNGIILFIDK